MKSTTLLRSFKQDQAISVMLAEAPVLEGVLKIHPTLQPGPRLPRQHQPILFPLLLPCPAPECLLPMTTAKPNSPLRGQYQFCQFICKGVLKPTLFNQTKHLSLFSNHLWHFLGMCFAILITQNNFHPGQSLSYWTETSLKVEGATYFGEVG